MDAHPAVPVLVNRNGCAMMDVPTENMSQDIAEASRPLANSELPGEDIMTPMQDASELATLFYDQYFMCPLDNCTKMFTAARNYRLHRSKFHKLARFNCVQCSQPFNSYNELHFHMDKEKHVIKCTKCFHVFRRVSDAANHYGQKHRTFKCLYCAAPLCGRQMYKEHLRLFHSREDTANSQEEGAEEEDGAYFLASAFVETTMNTSFKETTQELALAVYDVEEEDDNEVQFLEEMSLRDIQVSKTRTASESNSGDSGVQVLSERDDRDSGRDTVLEEAVQKTLPDSTSSVFRSAQLYSSKGSDTDTADAELPSDTDSAPEMTVDGGAALYPNPFYEPSFSCPIVFGPGANELMNSDAFTSNQAHSNNNQDASQWIGHNVDMYQSMSQEHKKTFRYNCGKCALTFKSKELLKRHARIHEHVCKHCFLRFTSLPEYKTHLTKHTSTLSTYLCSVCGHNMQGLKSLMVHEMRHRLNNAFKRKLEEFAQQNHSEKQLSHYECDICKEKSKNFSMWLRHEIWHTWPMMWTSYVVGRIFLGAFTEQDTKKFKQFVEDDLRVKWRDCCKEPESTIQIPGTCKESEVVEHAAVTSVSDDLEHVEESEDSTDEELNSDSECSENGIDTAINGWMSYWCSYLDVNESPPSWVVPILKQLRLQWRDYNTEEHYALYRKMDQIGVLIRAQRNEASILEGPRVVLKRVPISYIAQNTDLPGEKSSHENPCRESPRKGLSSSMLQSPSKRKIKDKDQAKMPQNKSSLPDEQSEKECTEIPCRESPRNVSYPSKLRSSMTGPIKRALPKQKEQIITIEPETNLHLLEPPPSSSHLRTVHTTLITSKSRKRTRSSLESLVPSQDNNTSSQVSLNISPLSPIVMLPKLVWPTPKPEEQNTKIVESHVKANNTPLKPGVVPSSSSGVSPSSFFLKLKWLKDQTGSGNIPKWVPALVKEVQNNPSFSVAMKMDKMYQIKNLIKLANGDIATCQTPVVRLAKGDVATGQTPVVRFTKGDVATGQTPVVRSAKGDVATGQTPVVRSAKGDIARPVVRFTKGDVATGQTPVVRSAKGDVARPVIRFTKADVATGQTPVVRSAKGDVATPVVRFTKGDVATGQTPVVRLNRLS